MLSLKVDSLQYSESMRTAFLLLLAPAKGNSTRQNSVAAGCWGMSQNMGKVQ
jgi:hypothetical protein